MATFTSFEAVASAWRTKYKVENVQREALELITKHLQLYVKVKHGATPPPNSPFTVAMKGKNSPLLDEGVLRAGVMRMVGRTQGIVWQDIGWLGMIQEYGAVITMSDKQRKWIFAMLDKHGLGSGGGGSGKIRIPPRPVWRTALDINRSAIYKIAQSTMKKYLTN